MAQEQVNDRLRQILAYRRGEAVTASRRSIQRWSAAYQRAEAKHGCGYLALSILSPQTPFLFDEWNDGFGQEPNGLFVSSIERLDDEVLDALGCERLIHRDGLGWSCKNSETAPWP